MQSFITPPGSAGADKLYGIEESINSNLERMFQQVASRNILKYGVGRTVSTSDSTESKLRLHAQQRECDAAITFHAGKSLELAMQLIYAYGTDRIIGREYPGVSESAIEKDVKRGHDLSLLYNRIIKEMEGRDMESAFEDVYQRALNRGIVDILVDDDPFVSQFETEEDIPLREQAIRHIADGIETTQDHCNFRDVLFNSREPSEFQKMPFDNFVDFLRKADATYYAGQKSGNPQKSRRKNMRWVDYSARDHEYGRPYSVAGVLFFARLAQELVSLAKESWIWHKDLRIRFFERRNYNISQLLKIHVMQNFKEEIDFPEMIPAEEAAEKFLSRSVDLADKVKKGYSQYREKLSYETKK